jgi:hypothetical protein
VLFWDESDGCLLTGLAVSGIEVARARIRLRYGTGEIPALNSRHSWLCEWRKGEPQAVKSREWLRTGRGAGKSDRLIVCAGRRREFAGESPVGPAPSGVRSRRRG